MTIRVTDFQPGIFADDSETLSEARYVDGSNVRFVDDRPQVIGGWEMLSSETYTAPVRGAHTWSALSGDRVLAFGTAKELVEVLGGGFQDITPLKSSGTLQDPFTTKTGETLVTVLDLDHGLKTGDVVTYTFAEPIGGLTLNGSYPVTVVTYDTYTITAASPASAASAPGGGSVDYSVPLDDGLVDGIGGTGYGTGLYGTGLYGLPTGGDIDPAVWSLDNWGSNLLALRNGGALFEKQAFPTYDEVLKDPSFDDGSTTWDATGGWSAGGGEARGIAGFGGPGFPELSQDVKGRLLGGLVYVLELVVFDNNLGNSFTFIIETAELDENDAPIRVPIDGSFMRNGTYRRLFYAPSRPTRVIFQTNGSFDGKVASISIKPESRAYRIHSAPAFSRGMFVDPHRIVVCYGTVESDGDYNAMCVRWSDKENNTVWLSDEDNLAGEDILARGSRIIGGLASRGQNLIWTDEALYTMRFTGDPATVFAFDLAGTGCGLLGKNAVAEHQGMAFWLGRNGQFYIFQGGEPQIIECPARKMVWGNLADSQSEKVFAGINAEFNEVWWFYPDKRDGTNECSRYIAYNFAKGTWFFGKMARSAWVRAGIFSNPIAFDPTNFTALYQERGVTANGDAIPWHLTTGRFNVEDGDKLYAILRYVPDFANQVGNILVKFTFWLWARGAAITTRTYEIKPTIVLEDGTVKPGTQEIPLRQMGRVAQIEWSNGTNSRSARWGAQGIDVVPTQARR